MVRKDNVPELSSKPWKKVEGELLTLIVMGDYHCLLREENPGPNLQQKPTNNRSRDKS